MAQTAFKKPQHTSQTRTPANPEDRKAADVLLDAARASESPETATRLRVVAALLHGQDVEKIRRNLSVTEKAILSYKELYDKHGLRGLEFRPSVIQGGMSDT
jgi:Predicted glycosylase